MATQHVDSHPYKAVAAAIVAKIKSGELRPDDRLPSVRALAAESGVSPMTAQRALAHLADAGYARAVAGLGYFVNDDKEIGEPSLTVEAITRQLDDLQAAVTDLSDRVQRLERGRGDQEA